jgi:hypothetical protein
MEGVGQQDHGGGEGIRVIQEVEHEQHGEEGHVQAAPYGEITTKILEIRIFRIEQLPKPQWRGGNIRRSQVSQKK